MSASLELLTLLILAALTASSLIVEVASAQATIEPYVPQFTLEYRAVLYHYPPEYGIDPYTGNNITVSYEHWIRQTCIVVTIQNQAFTPYTITDADGFNQTINLYYKVRSKGHFEEQWTQPKEGIYQIADYGAKKTTFYLYPDTTPANGQIDFQAQASIGYTYWKPNPNVGNTFAFGFTYFSGSDSNWSETQTITINDPNGGANHYYQLPEGLQSTACIEPTPQTSTLPPPTTPTSPAQNPTTTPTQAISGTDVELAANWENTTIILLCITALVSAVSLQFLHERNMKRHS